MRWLDRIPLLPLVIGAVLLGLAPFSPEPHLVRDLRWLFAGELTQPEDLFDLVFHGALPFLLILKLVRLGVTRRRA